MSHGVIFLRLSSALWAVGFGPFIRSSKRPTRTAFYLPGFFLDEKEPWWIPSEYREVSYDEFFRLWPAPVAFSREWSEPSRDEFVGRAENLLTEIHNGALKKAVPVVFERASGGLSLGEMAGMISRFRDLPERVFPYGYFWGDEGLIGVTPEFLLRDHGSYVESLALAGTTQVEYVNALLADPKELSEHMLVVQDLRERLGRYGSFYQGSTVEWPVGLVRHLRTDVRVEVSACIDFEDWISVLHPTPALGVSPRSRVSWLREQPEASVRRHFGAPFGLMRSGDFHLCLVAIRCLQWRSGELLLGSGCGVVAGSVPAREWEELRLKRRAVKKILGISSERGTPSIS